MAFFRKGLVRFWYKPWAERGLEAAQRRLGAANGALTATTTWLTPTTLSVIVFNFLMSLSGGLIAGHVVSTGEAFWFGVFVLRHRIEIRELETDDRAARTPERLERVFSDEATE